VQADLTAWVTTPFSFLASPVVFRGQLQGSASWSAAFNLVQLDTVLEDPWSGWNGSTFAWTCPAGCSGWYEVTLDALCTNGANSTAQLPCELYLNGARYAAASSGWMVNGHGTGSCGQVLLPMQPGDSVQFWVEPSVAVSAPATAGQYPAMEIAWLST
jgi:hypothetical protein